MATHAVHLQIKKMTSYLRNDKYKRYNEVPILCCARRPERLRPGELLCPKPCTHSSCPAPQHETLAKKPIMVVRKSRPALYMWTSVLRFCQADKAHSLSEKHQLSVVRWLWNTDQRARSAQVSDWQCRCSTCWTMLAKGSWRS